MGIRPLGWALFFGRSFFFQLGRRLQALGLFAGGLRGGLPGASYGLQAVGLSLVLRRGAPPSQLGVGLQPLGTVLWMACEVGLL